jgi:hypothetical protein
MKHSSKGRISAESRKGKQIPDPGIIKKTSTNNEQPLLSFQLFDFNHQCPSIWQGDEIKSLFQMFSKVCRMTWQDVVKTGGKPGNKTGLGFTEIIPDPFKRPATLSPDLLISELRVSIKARVFGVRCEKTYYVIRLDRNHQICKS